MSRTVVFLDTNLCLHWQPFDQIPWHRLLSADFARVVLCPPVTRELDVHKEQPRIAKIRERAQATMARVWSLRSTSNPAPIDEHAEFFAVTRDLRVDEVAGAADLNLALPDDALVAHAMAYRTSGDCDRVVIATGDYGVRLKAMDHGVETIEPPAEYRLPSAIDDVEQQIRKLKQENADLQQRAPNLALSFAAGGRRFVDALDQYVAPTAELRAEALAEERRRVSPIDLAAAARSREPRGVFDAMTLAAEVRDPKAAEKFNEEVEAYHTKWARFYDDRQAHRCFVAHTTTLSLQISNEGSSPAEDVDLDLEFHGPIVIVMAEDEVPKKPKAPPAPERPTMGLLDLLGRGSAFSGPGHADLFRSPIDPSRLLEPHWTFDTKKADRRSRASFHLKKLKHTLVCKLPPLMIVWKPRATPLDATLPYKFTIGNRAKPVCGELSLSATIRNSD